MIALVLPLVCDAHASHAPDSCHQPLDSPSAVQAEEATLEQVHQAVQVQAHVPPQRQLLVVCEERARFSSFPQLLQRLRKRWQARPAFKSLAISWANFALLPELFNRHALLAWRHPFAA